MAITACTTGSTTYITFSAGTDTPHAIYLTEEYSTVLSATTTVESIQCNTVRIGNGGYYS